jgi:hypothetical protein
LQTIPQPASLPHHETGLQATCHQGIQLSGTGFAYVRAWINDDPAAFTIFNADLKTDLQDNGVRLAWHSCLVERAPFCF